MALTNCYVSLVELASYSGTDYATDEPVRERAVDTASRWIDEYCGRHFYQATATARTFEPCSPYAVDFGCDLVSVTSFKTDVNGDGTFETTLSASDYELVTSTGSYNPAAVGEAWPYRKARILGTASFPIPTWNGRRNLIQVTGTWGWSAVPSAIEQATLLLAGRLLARKDAPFGVVAAGDLAFRTGRMDDDLVNILRPYRVQGGVGIA